MKIQIILKSPDSVDDCVRQAVADDMYARGVPDGAAADDERDELIAEVHKKLEKWIEYKEYLTVEFDLDAGTARVVERRT